MSRCATRIGNAQDRQCRRRATHIRADGQTEVCTWHLNYRPAERPQPPQPISLRTDEPAPRIRDVEWEVYQLLIRNEIYYRAGIVAGPQMAAALETLCDLGLARYDRDTMEWTALPPKA